MFIVCSVYVKCMCVCIPVLVQTGADERPSDLRGQDASKFVGPSVSKSVPKLVENNS